MNGNAHKYSPPGTEWTIMVYCAGDNELAPLIVQQLKGLKEAGPHKDVNVLVYFDANEKGVPTRLYCLNQFVRIRQRSPLDSWVPNMRDDDVLLRRLKGNTGAELRKRLRKPDTIDAKDSLSLFLRFCRENYPSKHYALVLMGHGMIVANDAFLPDESPVSAITLKELGETLSGFGNKLELIAMHSCSMSAVEVAYELKGKARCMIASEGISFVGSLPYRNLLMRTYSFINAHNGNGNTAHNGNGNNPRNGNGRAAAGTNQFDARDLIERLYKLSSHNGMDYMLSGYSQDLALINLGPATFEPLTKALQTLVSEMKKGLKSGTETVKQFVQLAHLESQSYYDENYTDLYDFCLLLKEKCDSNAKLKQLSTACEDVMNELEPGSEAKDIDDRFSKIVIHSRNFGSQYQYSHGLSIYFPWSMPVSDPKKSVLKKYEGYEFTKALGKQNSWKSFLDLYLEETKRKHDPPRITKDDQSRDAFGVGALSKPTAAFHKPTGASGASCGCPSIKNFPTESRTIKGKTVEMQRFRISRALKDKTELKELKQGDGAS